MIRQCNQNDTKRIYFIVNEAARAYEGVIPADCYHQPYMPMAELEGEMKRVTFFGWEDSGELVGIMGLEPVKDVSLIRHAYVLLPRQQSGIGSKLLQHILNTATTTRILVGTWADAWWAVDFYKKHGFRLMSDKDELLNTYWDVPLRQIDTSVVLGIQTAKRR